jgi:hypothetical protein
VNAWKVILATIVIFGAGVFSGGLLVNIVQHPHSGFHRPQPAAPQPEPQDYVPRPEILRTNFVQNLDNTIHLTPDQRATIEKIVASAQEHNRQLWLLIAPQIRSVNQETRQRIRAVLTDDQKKQFEELLRHARRPQNPTNAPSETPFTNSPDTNSPAI